jgi:protein TonB
MQPSGKPGKQRVKSLVQNTSLAIAVAVSILLHGALLAVHFVAPDSFKLKPADPGLEVILVNARHDSKPVKAEALAQANLDGGGNADAGRAKSPLPDLRRTENGDALNATRRKVAQLEAQQQNMLAQSAHRSPVSVAPKSTDRTPEIVLQDGVDDTETAKALARREAEIARNIEEYNKRPRKTQITPSTREVGYAMYYSALQRKIETLGTVNFPQKEGKKLYGELVLYIPIYQDGSIYEKDGGPRVERSSNNTALDNAAIRIVRRAAPFGRFPDNMRSSGKDDVWEVITRFRFTHDDALEADLRGGPR